MIRSEEQLDSVRQQTLSLSQQLDALRQADLLGGSQPSPQRTREAYLRVMEVVRELTALQQRIQTLLATIDAPPPESAQRRAASAMAQKYAARSRPTGVRLSLINRIKQWLGGALAQMSDDEVLRAVEAQTAAETIAEILNANPELRSGADNDWAELLVRGAETKNRIAGFVGGLLSSSEAAAVLGISVQGVKQRIERHKLLAVPLSGGQWAFPALQFAVDGRVRAGVPEVAKAGAAHDPWTVLSILVDDAPDGSGILLERLDDPAVLRDVLGRLATYGEHVAA